MEASETGGGGGGHHGEGERADKGRKVNCGEQAVSP